MNCVRSIFLLLAALFAATGALAQPKPPSVEQQPKITVTAVLAEDSVLVKQDIHFSGTIINDGSEPVSNISIAATPPGYSLKALHAFPTSGSNNQDCQAQTSSPIIANQLPKAGRLAFCGVLKADEAQPKRRINFIIQYSTLKGTSATTSSPGSVTVQTKWEYLGSKAYGVIKDLAFPLVLALFGLILKLITDKRELRAETWKQMLPQSHDLAGKFYMPIAGAAMGMSQAWGNHKTATTAKEKQEQARLIYHFILLFGRHMRDLRYSIGGFYFKDRIGEKIARRCWLTIRDNYFPSNDEQKKRVYSRAVRLVGKKEDVDVFLGKLDAATAGSPLEQSWLILNDMLARPDVADAMMQYFDLLSAILVYESNRVYHYWYRLPETLQLTPAQEIMVGNFFTAQNRKDARRYIALGKKG